VRVSLIMSMSLVRRGGEEFILCASIVWYVLQFSVEHFLMLMVDLEFALRAALVAASRDLDCLWGKLKEADTFWWSVVVHCGGVVVAEIRWGPELAEHHR
jgi:hypothetical protein